MSKLTDEIAAFDQKLRTTDGRSPTDSAVVHLSQFILELSKRIDRIIDEDVQM
jgi:hypothetical protein